MRSLFSKLSFALLALGVLVCGLPQPAEAYWHGGIYVGGPVAWGPPPAVVYAAPPVVVQPAPVIVSEPPPVVQAPPNQVSMQCASGPTVTVTGYKSTPSLLRQAARLCAKRDAAAPPSSRVTWSAPEGAPPGQTCREYQSKIMVGGQPQQAYGTACLQPDGSWKPVQAPE